MNKSTNSIVLAAVIFAFFFIIIPNSNAKLYEISNFFHFTHANQHYPWWPIILGAFAFVLILGYKIGTTVYNNLIASKSSKNQLPSNEIKRFFILIVIYIAILAIAVIINYFLYHRI